MGQELRVHRVEVSFVGLPPAQQVERASGVSDVNLEGRILRCLVCGSFQPFLEALRGHEVVSLTSIPTGPLHPTRSARSSPASRPGLDTDLASAKLVT
jgi:hypothetical protein